MNYLSIAVLLVVYIQSTIHCDDIETFNPQRNAEFLCKNKQANITKISQVKAVIDFLKSNNDFNCDTKIRESILDLEETISKDLNDVCNPDKVQNIRDYHEKYIVINQDEPNKTPLPRSLRNFFLGFGLKVSYICKKNMINSLLYDPHEMLDADDFKRMNLWTNKSGSMMNDIIGSPTDYDDLVLAGDLNYIKSDSGPTKEKLYIQTATSQLIRKIQISCQRRFKPFYEKLIIPLVTLSNIGYNFQGEELERELNEMKTNVEVNQWYRIVYLCESLNDMELIENNDEQVGGDVSDQKVVRILTKEEALKLKSERPDSFKTSPEDEQLKQIDYKLQAQIPIDDNVIDDDDRNLTKLINNFDDKKKEADRIRTKIFRKLGGFVTNVLKNKKIKFVTDFFQKKLFDKEPEGDQKNHAKEDMVFAIDEFVQLRTEDVDMPVSGVMDYVHRIHHNAVYMGPSGVAEKVKKGVKYWTFSRIFWYIIAGIVFAIGVAMFISVVG